MTILIAVLYVYNNITSFNNKIGRVSTSRATEGLRSQRWNCSVTLGTAMTQQDMMTKADEYHANAPVQLVITAFFCETGRADLHSAKRKAVFFGVFITQEWLGDMVVSHRIMIDCFDPSGDCSVIAKRWRVRK